VQSSNTSVLQASETMGTCYRLWDLRRHAGATVEGCSPAPTSHKLNRMHNDYLRAESLHQHLALSTGKPIHTWNPRPRQLALLPVFVFLMLLGIWASSLEGPFYTSSTCTGRCYPPGLVVFLGLFLTVGGVWEVIRARKLEFYEESVRLVGKRGSPNQDFPYDRLTVGSLLQYRSTHYFVLSADAPERPLVFHINNERIKGTDQSLYDWLKDTDTEREKLTPEVLKAESVKSRFRFITPVGIIAGVVLIIIGPEVFWTIPATPAIDSNIGLGFIVAGFLLIAAILVVRGALNARYTSH
jgi:hypothetical protein